MLVNDRTLRPRKRQPEERLARLVSTAAEVFGRDGFARAQIQDVCHAAGVSVGTFYQHFENKAELLLHLAELAVRDIPTFDAASRPRFEQQIAAYVSSPRVKLWRAWREAVLSEPALRPAAARLRQHCEARLERWVGEVRAARGLDAPKIDDQTTAWLIFTAMRELVVEASAAPPERSINAAGALWCLLVE